MEVGEVLNEVEYGKGLIVRGKSYLVFGSKQQTKPSLEAIERFIQLEKHLPGVMFFSNLRGKTYEAWKTKFINAVSRIFKEIQKSIKKKNFFFKILNFFFSVFRPINIYAKECAFTYI